jgi:DnaJ homolog subfamily C member 17
VNSDTIHCLTKMSDELPPDLDLYAFLSVAPTATEAEIRSAYRKQSLLYHPDKNPSESAAQTFHQLKLASNILLSASARAAYDNVRRAKAAKAERTAKYDDERRRLQQDLESREREAKRRKFDGGRGGHSVEEEERIFRQEVEKLMEESQRLKREREKRLQEDFAREHEPRQNETSEDDEGKRTVKIKFRKGFDRDLLSVDVVEKMFSRYGGVENVVLGKSALVVFDTVIGAKAALRIVESRESVANMFKEVTIMTKDGPSEDALTKDNSELKNGPQSSEPQSKNEPQKSPKSKSHAPNIPFSSTKPKFSFRPLVPPGSQDGEDYESITLARMRKIAKERQSNRLSTLTATTDSS